jgi:hypothetical protein
MPGTRTRPEPPTWTDSKRRRLGTDAAVYRRGPGIGLLGVVYAVVGAIVANSHHYFDHVNTLREFFSAVLAVLLWPLILLGIDLHIKK